MKNDEKCNAERFNPIYKELTDIVGFENTLKIYDNYKGTQLSFNKSLYSKEYIKQKIRSEYDGTNIKMLSAKYDYSERWIRKILGKN